MSILDTPTHNIPEPEKVSNWPVALRYSLILAAITFAISLVGFITDTDPSHPATSASYKWTYSLLSLSFSITAVIWAIRHDRDQLLQGFIEFGRCIGLSAKMGLITGILSAIGQILLTRVINPGFMESVQEATRDQLEAKGMSDTEIDMAMEYTAMFTGVVPMAIMTIIVTVIFMLIIGLVAGAVMKKSAYPE